MTHRRFSEYSPQTRGLVGALGALQVGLNLAAQIDISRRSASELRGSKLRWRLISMINIFGPLAYFRWGRQPSPS